MHGVTRWGGIRALRLDRTNQVGVFHQALNHGTMPYLAEFDLPLAVHGYNIKSYRKVVEEARHLMERQQLRALIVFSDWAKRSFELHFGPEAGEKCQVVYPLPFEGAYCGQFDCRAYDFTFISSSFRIKCGPETVRAFCHVRSKLGQDRKMCVVTNLAEARRYLGDLSTYSGVEWREANLSEAHIAALLADTHCLVHPSLSDSFGVVVLEALAAGCAVIASDMASFPELVGKDNGWLIQVPTGSVVGDSYITEFGTVKYHEGYLNALSLHKLECSLREIMVTFLQDPNKAQAMMQSSYARYEKHFSPAVWCHKFRNILSKSFPELGMFCA